MKEHIEREAALAICEQEYQERLKQADWCGDTVAWNIGGAIKGLPAADVVEVRHGRWIVFDPKNAESKECSMCGYLFSRLYPSNYCPNCGARMDKEDDHETD